MNEVRIIGTLTRAPKAGGEGDRAWCFFSLKTKEERSSILDCAAFGDASRIAATFSEGDEVKLLGRVGAKEDKKLSEVAGRKVWVMQVVAEKLGHVGPVKPPPPPAREPGSDEDIDF